MPVNTSSLKAMEGESTVWVRRKRGREEEEEEEWVEEQGKKQC